MGIWRRILAGVFGPPPPPPMSGNDTLRELARRLGWEEIHYGLDPDTYGYCSQFGIRSPSGKVYINWRDTGRQHGPMTPDVCADIVVNGDDEDPFLPDGRGQYDVDAIVAAAVKAESGAGC